MCVRACNVVLKLDYLSTTVCRNFLLSGHLTYPNARVMRVSAHIARVRDFA